MSTDHVVARKMRPIAECSEVIGLMPLECQNCGEVVHIGLPISISDMCALVAGFQNLHNACKKGNK